jgi:cardiolipin synthase
MESFKIFTKPVLLFNEMIKDIMNSKKSVYLESYIYDNDKIGKAFLDALVFKAKQGIKIKVLLDGFGPNVKKRYFNELINNRGEVRFFREISYYITSLFKNHERNHRKLLVIDDKICYIGSANITESCLCWREIGLKVVSKEISLLFSKSFQRSWKTHNILNPKKIKSLVYKGFEIIQDIPSYIHKITEKKYIRLINDSKKEINIETPYFVPSKKIRKSLYKAVKRGIRVNIVIPRHSGVRIVDFVRNNILGELYENGINLWYYNKHTHSKLLIVDNRFFLLGSSNLDYRSFLHQYEINFLGNNKFIIKLLKKEFYDLLKNAVPFNYNEWKNRSYFRRSLEKMTNLIKKYI